MTTTAVQAQQARNLPGLARVDAALSARHEYETNQLLPPDRRRPRAWPGLTRGGPKGLQLMLGKRIGELERSFEWGWAVLTGYDPARRRHRRFGPPG